MYSFEWRIQTVHLERSKLYRVLIIAEEYVSLLHYIDWHNYVNPKKNIRTNFNRAYHNKTSSNLKKRDETGHIGLLLFFGILIYENIEWFHETNNDWCTSFTEE